ncbi:hypothetical protein XCY_002647 [Xanthomonas arboricola pv. juglandis]|uniref:hypothetical protein n=1 Tax=Xanthomonas arboricola TaxID=56448 RepID=UPI0011B04465|nr:hypothetical protein [Xanthomonas arboricola]CAG2092257.1 hypothetical protein XCY_002647 [Xanthomonas arboricola pv. juglandis]
MTVSKIITHLITASCGVVVGAIFTFSFMSKSLASADEINSNKLSAAYDLISPTKGTIPSSEVIVDRAYADFGMSLINAAPSYDTLKDPGSRDRMRAVANQALDSGAIDRISQIDLRSSAKTSASCLKKATTTDTTVVNCLESQSQSSDKKEIAAL